MPGDLVAERLLLMRDERPCLHQDGFGLIGKSRQHTALALAQQLRAKYTQIFLRRCFNDLLHTPTMYRYDAKPSQRRWCWQLGEALLMLHELSCVMIINAAKVVFGL